MSLVSSLVFLVLHYYTKQRMKNDLAKWRRKDDDNKIFLCIPGSAVDAAAVNPNEIETLLANGLITFFINGNPVVSNGPRSLPINPPDCIILGI